MKKRTYILGISAYYHDSAASILGDGEILAAAQEERFTRKKGDARFPTDSVAYCLEEAGIDASEIDLVVFYENPYVKFDRLMATCVSFWPEASTLIRGSMPVWSSHRLRISQEIENELGTDLDGRIYYTDHHLSHAASAFFPSPFEDAAILTLDAVGEWSTSSIGMGEGNRVRLLKDMRFPHSVGMLYSAFTYYTGFKVNSGEYKLMGLAPYGDPEYVDTIRRNMIAIKNDGSLWMDMSYFDYARGRAVTSDKFHDLFGGPPRKPDDLITQKDMNLAASIQAVTEEIMLRAARHAHELTGCRNLVMAGGVALNCVANGRILREGPFDKVWVQPAAGDAGGSLGAALLAWHHHLGESRRPGAPDAQKGSFIGPSFAPADIRGYLDSVGAVYDHAQDEDAILETVADLMAAGKTIGWFSGRMEFGPRALGGRSIIGDARSEKMQQVMNLKIKFRESFRPFAPCVLREHVHEYFEMEKDEDSPYMLLVADVRKELRREMSGDELEQMKDPDLRIRVSVPRSSIPAITHVDYSARVQTVDEHRHGRYYRLIKRFHEKTGCPVIVNTSFNVRGEPLVCTPENAYICFMATDMDCLVMDDFVLLKSRQQEGLLPGIAHYRNSIEAD